MIRILLAVVLLLGLALGWSLWRAESHKGRADRAQEASERTAQTLTDTQAALEAERAYSLAISKIAGQHERDKYEIEQQASADLAALRAGNLRLHDRWQACSATAGLSSAVATASQSDGGSDDRYQSAVRAVQYAAQCRAQVKGLQAVVLADRGQTP